MEIETRICPTCEEKWGIKLTDKEWKRYGEWRWYKSVMIQEALPKLNPMEREFLKSGYCPECQSLLFGTDYKSKKIFMEED